MNIFFFFFICKSISYEFCIASTGFNYDDDELEDELRELEQEELDKELLSTGTRAPDLPEVPTGDIKAPASGENKKGNKKNYNKPLNKVFSIVFYIFLLSSCGKVHRR